MNYALNVKTISTLAMQQITTVTASDILLESNLLIKRKNEIKVVLHNEVTQ